MSTEKTLRTLRERLEKEKAAYEDQLRENEKYVRLPRKRYFSACRRLDATSRRIAALKTAVELLEKPFREVDVHEGCTMGLSPNREDWQETLEKACSRFLRERAEAAKVLFETSLPTARKQVLAELERWLPDGNPGTPAAPQPADALFRPDKDDPVADTAADPGFDTRPLIGRFGPEVTWRQVFLAGDNELEAIPGYGEKTVEKIRRFLGEHLGFSFTDLITGKDNLK